MIRNLRIYSNNVVSKLTIHNLIALLKKELNISIDTLEITFVNSAEMILVNKKYLRHNNSTDIITFDYSTTGSSIEGEMIISEDDAILNAKRFKTSPHAEIMRLIIHGILHLLGYEDSKSQGKRIMKRKENYLVNKYKFLINDVF